MNSTGVENFDTVPVKQNRWNILSCHWCFMSHKLISIDLFCTVGFIGIQKLNLKFKFDKSVFSTHQTSYFTLRQEIQNIVHIILSIYFYFRYTEYDSKCQSKIFFLANGTN